MKLCSDSPWAFPTQKCIELIQTPLKMAAITRNKIDH